MLLFSLFSPDSILQGQNLDTLPKWDIGAGYGAEVYDLDPYFFKIRRVFTGPYLILKYTPKERYSFSLRTMAIHEAIWHLRYDLEVAWMPIGLYRSWRVGLTAGLNCFSGRIYKIPGKFKYFYTPNLYGWTTGLISEFMICNRGFRLRSFIKYSNGFAPLINYNEYLRGYKSVTAGLGVLYRI